MNPYIQIIAAFFGSLGFALLFNLRGQWLFFTALGGGLSWCVYLISGSFISHYERQYFAAAFFLGIYSELMARKTKSPSTLRSSYYRWSDRIWYHYRHGMLERDQIKFIKKVNQSLGGNYYVRMQFRTNDRQDQNNESVRRCRTRRNHSLFPFSRSTAGKR